MKTRLFFTFIILSNIIFSQQLKTTEKRVEIDLKDGRYNETV
jgi:hypothetical protein